MPTFVMTEATSTATGYGTATGVAALARVWTDNGSFTGVTVPTRPVPELGPLLGRMASPAPRGPAELPLDDIRFELLSALYIRAGLARGEFAAGRPDVARHQLGRDSAAAAANRPSSASSSRAATRPDASRQTASQASRPSWCRATSGRPAANSPRARPALL